MAGLLRPLTIGNVRLPNNLVLSPMAGFSDLPFRVLCRRHGAGLVCSEMVAATSVVREIPNTLLRMQTLADETPMSIQLFGTDAAAVEQAARDLDARCAIVGFNMGCPAHQIKRQGCGAAMLDKPDWAIAMLRAVRRGTDKPVMAKMRLGNRNAIDYVDFAKRLDDEGVDALIVHGRTAAQGYSGHSDWAAIAAIKAAVDMPIIGNGDIRDGATAARALAISGVDGLAIGRATLGDPHIFARIAHELDSGEALAPHDAKTRFAEFEEYLDMALALGLPLIQIREQAQKFTRDIPGAPQLRTAFTKLHSADAVRAAFCDHVIDLGAADPRAVTVPSR